MKNTNLFKRINHTPSFINNKVSFNSFKIENIDKIILEKTEKTLDILETMKHKVLGFSEKMYEELIKYNNVINKIIIDKNIDDTIVINYDFNEDNNTLLDFNIIEVKEGVSANINIFLNGKFGKNYHNGALKLIAHENSLVKLVVVENLSYESENYYNISIDAKKNSDVKYYEALFGSSVNSVSVRANLLEDDAKVDIYPAYFSDRDRKLDIEYTLKFFGKRCIGNISANGVTKDKSQKVFRGNLIFEKGSTKSEGSEGEFSILLSKEANAQSIPTLFCEEDDVIGAHSANIGKINQDKLYYLMSRGLTEKEAKKMVILSAIGPVLEEINNDKVKENILIELDDRI